MTDLEAMRLCAEAMGAKSDTEVVPNLDGGYWDYYDPLNEDAQAMALVKKLGLACITELGQGREMWRVHHWRDAGHGYHASLNHAIVYFVATLRSSSNKSLDQ